ncbi:MAG: helix-turn-helix domain-containing protein, partial [Vicinamibacteria bacterium]
MLSDRSHPFDDEDLGLGLRLRDARHRAGLTLNDLAARAKLSIGTLSQIENHQRIPNVRQLFLIARGLGVSAESLLSEEVSFPYQLTREGDLRARKPQPPTVIENGPRDTFSNLFWPLADRFVGRHLEPFLGQILPVPDAAIRHYYHHEDEFLFVYKGSIEVQIKTPDGLQTEALHRGDCVYLRAGVPHALRSTSSQPAESIHVTSGASTTPAVGWNGVYLNGAGWVADEAADPLHLLGKELELLRTAHGWSSKEVARMAGIKPKQLEQIERGERAVPLNLITRLARVYRKPLRRLIRSVADDEPYFLIRRASDIQRTQPRTRRTPVDARPTRSSQIFYPLAGGFPTRHMYPYLVKLLNVEVGSLTPHEHNGEEFFFVLDGELELTTYTGEEKGNVPSAVEN